jgi:hypothetical protein
MQNTLGLQQKIINITCQLSIFIIYRYLDDILFKKNKMDQSLITFAIQPIMRGMIESFILKIIHDAFRGFNVIREWVC